MSPSPTQIFAPALFRRRLARANAAGVGSADFLLRRAIADVDERLDVIKRDFAAIADIATPSPELARRLAARFATAVVLRMAPVAEPPVGGLAGAIVGDIEALPLAAGAFDLAVSVLALQHANDLPGALVQIRRALKPDGLFLGCLLGGQSLHELRTALAAAESELYGGLSPRVAPFAEVRDMGGLLQRAGFALPVADSEPLTVRYADMFGLMADLRAMGGANPLAARLRRPSTRGFFQRAAQIYAARFADPDGRIRASFELIFLSGWAPHESQQKPLRPGSAKMRLADALGTTEITPRE
ncbi:methyltransferase domain-containing protein [Methylocapsa acidiphila]|uniref:methyltransferase domain-containing protein n=1 Tax=Methylocapsa acidiphila TaxID=133552 RepID=UPI0003F7C826|nr:methyltransferase domain-containing protein [Methylocapsa acidiphila]